MAMSRAELERRLDQLDADVPALQGGQVPEFWPAFAGLADEIADNAGEHGDWVAARISSILEKHGLSEHGPVGE